MRQLPLLPASEAGIRLPTHIIRDGHQLSIPEGVDTTQCTHGMHRFAGKFIPNIARHIIRTYLSPGSAIVLDPFCGSGTTLVEAALEGRKFIGVDIDPLSVLIAEVKTSVLTETELEALQKHWADHDYTRADESLLPQVPNLSHWFSPAATQQLTSIKRSALLLPVRLQRFSLVVFSSILRRVSNADDQTQKTYVSHTLPKTPPLPSELFPVHLSRAIEGMRQFSAHLPSKPSGRVVVGDAKNDLPADAIHDIVTSPPYIDSIDYPYNQMLEYFWLLDELGLHSYEAYRQLRRQPMGFALRRQSECDGFAARYLKPVERTFEQLCSQIGKRSPKEELAVRSFFLDYALHVSRARSALSESGRYISVVGDSTIRGNIVPTTAFITAIHESLGYALHDKVSYAIRRHYMKFPRRANSGTITTDTILAFRRDK